MPGEFESVHRETGAVSDAKFQHMGFAVLGRFLGAEFDEEGAVGSAGDGMTGVAETEVDPTLAGVGEFQELIDGTLEFHHLGLGQLKLPGQALMDAPGGRLVLHGMALELLQTFFDERCGLAGRDFAFGQQMFRVLELLLKAVDLLAQLCGGFGFTGWETAAEECGRSEQGERVGRTHRHQVGERLLAAGDIFEERFSVRTSSATFPGVLFAK